MNYPDSPRLSAQRLEHELPGSAIQRVCQVVIWESSRNQKPMVCKELLTLSRFYVFVVVGATKDP